MSRKSLLKSRAILTIVICAAIVAIVIYGAGLKDDGRSNRVVRITDCLNVANIHMLVAKSKGFFTEEGLTVRVNYVSVGKLAMDNLVNGGADYAGVTEMNIAQMMFSDPEYQVLTEMGESITGIKMLGRKDKGVNKPSDLRGKKIAVLIGVNIHVILTKVLDSVNIPMSDLTIVNLKPADAATAFIGGDVDAIITWEPLLSKINDALGDGAVQIVPDTGVFWTYKMILAAKTLYLQTHKEEAKALLRALMKADNFIQTHKDEVYDLVAEHLSLNREKVPKYLGEIHHEIRLSDKLVAMINEEMDWYPKFIPEFKNSKPLLDDASPVVSKILSTVHQ